MATDNLFPDDLLEDEVEVGDEEGNYAEDEGTEDTSGYRYSIYFDFGYGDFVVGHDGKLLEASGIEAWEQWCKKVVQTQRYSHAAYSTDIGIDFDKAVQAESRAEAENILYREITEALQADPSGRTQYVDSISFNWNADGCDISVVVQGIDGNVEVEASYTYDDSKEVD